MLRKEKIPGLLHSRMIDGQQHLLVADQDDSFATLLKSHGAENVQQLSVNLERAVNAFLSANHNKPDELSVVDSSH